ncbi:MAG: ATP-binding protein [Ardenticatenaceae bacterium]|nr:ATP-binding protein [Ardenticatenaceae bacterium]
MYFYRRLRWRLIGAPLLVAIVGTSCMLVLTYIIAFQLAPDLLNQQLIVLLENPDQIERTQGLLLETFRSVLIRSVLIAAIFAMTTGVIYSVILWSSLVVPLRNIAASSQRIANGRYEERVEMPQQNVGEAITQVVTNFNQMADALETVENKRVALIGNVTHELRTPLTSLRGYLEGLQDGLFEPNAETLAILQNEVDRLSRLVEDIQTLSKVESRAIKLDIQPINLSEIVEQVVFQFQPQANQQHVDLVYRGDKGEQILVMADQDRTIQILTNLVGNALRYTSEGGEVQLQINHQGAGTAAIIVSDTGIGIPAEALPYVFERFYRVDGSRSRESGGSGVGLTISRHLAWIMGGELTAASPGQNQGSTFTLTLPRKS